MTQKQRTQKAIERYIQKQMPSTKLRRKNGSPEKLVEKEVLTWCKQRGWSVSVIESKAAYSKAAGRFLPSVTQQGHSDISGSTPEGRAAFLELKAPGRISAARISQLVFLKEKIQKNCFAVVIDSADLLERIYQGYLQSQNPQQYLLDALPTPKEMRDQKTALFD